MLRYPTDIPIHRASVGAMGLNDPPAPEFKTYTYGQSRLALRPKVEDFDLRENTPKPKKRKPKKRKPRRVILYYDRHVLTWRHEQAKIAAQERWARTKKRNEEAARRRAEAAAKWAADQEWVEAIKQRREDRPSRPVRPSVGWKPMTGEDIDALLEEM